MNYSMKYNDSNRVLWCDFNADHQGSLLPRHQAPAPLFQLSPNATDISSLLMALNRQGEHHHQQQQQQFRNPHRQKHQPFLISSQLSLAHASFGELFDYEERQQQQQQQLASPIKSLPQQHNLIDTNKNNKSTSKQDANWMSMLDQLVAYKKRFGNTVVPRGYQQNPKLGSWVAEQRKQYKLLKDGKPSNISSQRIQLLNEIGFVWNAQKSAWDQHMADLKTFRCVYGHTLVPLSHPQFPKLGLWCKEQRRHNTLMKQGKKSHMTPSRQAQLDSIGFIWDSQESAWEERYRELAEFRARFGSCTVPSGYAQDQKLRTWIHHQRRNYKKFLAGKPCHITRERIEKLEALGFVWSPRGEKQGGADDSNASSVSSDFSSEGSSFAVDHLEFPAAKRQRFV
jgi:hypothetical protein